MASATSALALGRREPTFRVEGHHYALVRVESLEPASSFEYEVALDGRTRWPEPSSDLPPSVIRTLGAEGPLDVCFGSCRVALPHRPFLLSPGFHHLEAWNERMCDGALGPGPARASEKLRRAVDFDHWASFALSFERLRASARPTGIPSTAASGRSSEPASADL